MAYRIDIDRPLAKELPRIVCEQIDQAVKELTASRKPPQNAVHQARKHFKKIRALLRLVRHGLDDSYDLENAFYRDLAGGLRELRDADVLIQRFDELLQPRLARSEGMRRIRKGLVKRRDALVQVKPDLTAVAGTIAAKLSAGRERAARWAAGPFSVEVLDEGFRRIYRRGRKAMKTAWEDSTTESWHEWRKAVKNHWYHTRLLHQVWPQRLKSRGQRLDQLGEMLGEWHDLSILIDMLNQKPGVGGKQADRARVAQLAEERRMALRDPILEIGERSYDLQAGFLTRRLRAHLDRKARR